MDKLNQSTGIDQARTKMHEALDAAMEGSLQKVDSV